MNGECLGVEVAMEERRAEYLGGENGQDLRVMFLPSKLVCSKLEEKIRSICISKPL